MNANVMTEQQLMEYFKNGSEKLMEIFKNGTEKERAQIAQLFANKNVSNRNNDKTEKYAEKIIKRKNKKVTVYEKFLQSNSVNGLIYAPTQVGKSAATRVFIETCFRHNIPVIVSTDNKTDQQEQLYNRIEYDLAGASVEMLKVTDKHFEKDLKECIEENKRFVIFCLDNFSQIEKVIIQLSSNYTRSAKMSENLKKIALIHDEADTVAKDQDTVNISTNQAASHKKWLELTNMINKRMGSIDLKRLFVTATPDNVCLLYKIDCPDVMRLEIPATYTGYNQIEHVELENDLNIGDQLEDEVNRIHEAGTFEAILYCIERKIVAGHDVLLRNLSDRLDCVVNTYNGDGITTYIKKSLRARFEKKLNKNGIEFQKVNRFYKMKNMAIRKFYKIVKSLGENCVVTIGKDLICRGISYVGEDIDEPIVATTMFYRSGETMNAVGICQTIGRITGCAGMDMQRRLYCPKEIYDDYMKYNRNQEAYIKKIEKSEKTTEEVINSTVFEGYERPIDRPKLNLTMKWAKKTKKPVESEDESDSEDEEENRMEKLIDMWWGKKTIIGKILSYTYENEGADEDDLKEFIEECGSKDASKMYHHLISKTKEYKLVFKRKNNITDLNKEARKYIDDME